MLKQHIIVIGPEDVARVRLVCVGCGAELARRTNEPRPLPGACGTCGASWTALTKDNDPARQLVDALYQAVVRGTGGLEIRFEVDDDEH